MKSLKVAKYQIKEGLSAIRNYYIIFILSISIMAYTSIKLSDIGKLTSSGLEFATVIFLFVMGLNSFREEFWFSQANNISRKSFFQGTLMGILPVAFFLSMMDIIINRVYNIFVKSPTIYDQIYGTMKEIIQGNDIYGWTTANDIKTLFGTFAFQFGAYTMVFMLGLFISMLYYRSNKITKIIISLIPFGLMVFSYNIFNLFPTEFWDGVAKFIANAFGWHSGNPYMGALTLLILGSILSGFSYLLIRRAVVKE